MYPIPAHFRTRGKTRGSKTQAKNVRAQKENNGDNRLSLLIHARESNAPYSAISLRLESVIGRVHACCVLVTKLCVRTFRSLCHCDELLFLTKVSFLELGSLGLLSSFIKLTEKVSSSLALSRCRFETNKKLRLHAIILFAFARLNIYTHAVYIHTQYARAQT